MSPQIEVSIKAQNLRVNYGSFEALNIPELDLSGSVFAVIGHNGSGKSTFIKTILSLLQPKCGTLCAYAGKDASSCYFRPESDMAFSPEEGAVFDDLTVETYIRLWCRLKHHNKNFYKSDVGASVVKKFHIDELFKKLGRALSKGQRRRVQTAIGFLTDPKLFLFDEPFDGLDIEQSRRLAGIIQEESQKRAILISSHRMEIVERLADKVIVLDDGKLIAAGEPHQVAAELCSGSFIIRAANQEKRILGMLRNSFDMLLSYGVPGGVIVCGNELNASFINGILTKSEVPNYTIEPVSVSLVDAMHFHLRWREKKISPISGNIDGY